MVKSAQYSVDGARILTASHDHSAKIWDANTGELLQTLAFHKYEILSASWSPTGDHVLIATTRGDAQIWDVGTAKIRKTLRHRKDNDYDLYLPLMHSIGGFGKIRWDKPYVHFCPC